MKIKYLLLILVLAGCADMSLKPVGRSCATGGECRTSYCWNGTCLEPPDDDRETETAVGGIGVVAGFAADVAVSRTSSSGGRR